MFDDGEGRVEWAGPRLSRVFDDGEGRVEWSSPPPHPPSPLQRSIKMTNEPPKGMRANLMGSFGAINEAWFEDCAQPKAWKRLLFGLCFFHAVVQEVRRRCGCAYVQQWSVFLCLLPSLAKSAEPFSPPFLFPAASPVRTLGLEHLIRVR